MNDLFRWLIGLSVLAAACSGGNMGFDTGSDDASDSGVHLPPHQDSSIADVAPVMFTPSNFTLSQAQIAGAPAVMVDTGTAVGDCAANTATGSWSCSGSAPAPMPPMTQITQSDGTTALLWSLHSLSVAAGSSLSINGPVPAILYVQGAVTIDGAVIVTAAALTCGAGLGNHAMLGTGGAGGGSFCGVGGRGSLGDGTDSGGMTYGMPTLVPLVGGSGGGSFAQLTNAGGALQITSSLSISVSGSISAGGQAGISDNDGAANFGDGGGSGGAILLESGVVLISGTLAANGGGGGSAVGAGSPASASASPARGDGRGGGSGSGGATTAGAPGTSTGSGLNATNGGGGGGAGRIRINTSSGAAIISANAMLSPAVSTACVSQGTVH